MAGNYELRIASSLGFCGGVRRAMEAFERLRAETPVEDSVYVLHELVHNCTVTEQMRARGAVFISAPEELPEGARCLIGAHGVGAQVERRLRERTCYLVDATCPIVKKVQKNAAKLKDDETLVLFGVRGHPEAEGILGHAGTARNFLVTSVEEIAELPELSKPVFLCQTTMENEQANLVFAALYARFPDARRDGSICHASEERQKAVEELVKQVDILLVIGSAHSSNANRLKEIGERAGISSYLIEGPKQLPADLASYQRIGLSAGASTPEEQVRQTIEAIQQFHLNS